MNAFPAAIPFNMTGTASLLGAPVGLDIFCEAYTLEKRVDKALPLLRALKDLPDPQTALLLLRHCASYSKVVFATRVTPPSALAQAMGAFDHEVLSCLEALCGVALTAASRVQATLSTACGGLGLRSAARHSCAAYLASLLATGPRSRELDAAYSDHCHFTEPALASFNTACQPADRLLPPAQTNLPQRQLSSALDQAAIVELTASAPGREAFRAHLALLQQPGAGSWLAASASTSSVTGRRPVRLV